MLTSTNTTYTIVEETFDSLDACWRDSRHHLRWDCLFVLPGWLKAWWQAFGNSQTPYICSIRSKDKLIGIAPLMIEGETACLMGDTDVCDFLDVIVAPGNENEFFETLFSHLRKQGIRQVDLAAVRPDSAIFRYLTPAAQEPKYTVACQTVDASMVLNLPASWDEYLLQLTGKQRHEVRRKFRRLEEAGQVDLHMVDDGGEVDNAMDTFLALFKQNREDKARFMSSNMASYFHSLALEMAAAGILKLFFLTIDDALVAAVMCFDYNMTFYLYNNGYDHQYRSLSVGMLSKLLTLKECIRQGKKKYDFLKGTEVYKHRLGGVQVPIHRCQVKLV